MKPQNPVRTVWLTLLTLAFIAVIGLCCLIISHQSSVIESLRSQLQEERAAHIADVQKSNEAAKKSVRFFK